MDNQKPQSKCFPKGKSVTLQESQKIMASTPKPSALDQTFISSYQRSGLSTPMELDQEIIQNVPIAGPSTSAEAKQTIWMQNIDLQSKFKRPSILSKTKKKNIDQVIIPEPTTSSDQGMRKLEETDVETQKLIQRVVLKCSLENRVSSIIKGRRKIGYENAKFKDIIERVMSYTGLSRTAVIAINENPDLEIEIESIEDTYSYRENIRATICELWLSSVVPTTYRLFEKLSVKKRIPLYWCTFSLRRHLVKMGYTWVRFPDILPCQNTLHINYIMEKPDLVFERFNYLKTIIKHREDGRPIFFVDENFYDSFGNYYRSSEYEVFKEMMSNEVEPRNVCFIMYGVSKNGFTSVSYFDEITDESYQDWLVNQLMPLLPLSSVVVCHKTRCGKPINTRPTTDSLKAEIMEFLDQNDVPYRPDMRKPELIDLVNLIPYSRPKYRVDEIYTANGHEILRLPDNISSLSPASLLFKDILTILPSRLTPTENPILQIQVDLTKVISLIKDCAGYDAIIAAEEIQCMDLEMTMDSKIEEMITTPGNHTEFKLDDDDSDSITDEE